MTQEEVSTVWEKPVKPSAMEELHPIPALNPDSLQKICLEYILLWIKRLRIRETFAFYNKR